MRKIYNILKYAPCGGIEQTLLPRNLIRDFVELSEDN